MAIEDDIPSRAAAGLLSSREVVQRLVEKACEEEREPDLDLSLGVEDERIRLVSNVAVAINLSPQSLHLRKSIPGLTVESLEHFCVLNSGARCARLGCFLSILFPNNGEKAAHTLGIVSRLFLKNDQPLHWVLDLSPLTRHEPGFISELFSFHKQVKRQGASVSLVWVPSGAFSDAEYQQLLTQFQPIKSGRFYQSRILPSLR